MITATTVEHTGYTPKSLSFFLSYKCSCFKVGHFFFCCVAFPVVVTQIKKKNEFNLLMKLCKAGSESVHLGLLSSAAVMASALDRISFPATFYT